MRISQLIVKVPYLLNRNFFFSTIDKLNIKGLFESIQGGPLKKESAIISVFKLEKVKKKEMVYFGDHTNDFLAAKNACIYFIGINADKKSFNEDCLVFPNFKIPKSWIYHFGELSFQWVIILVCTDCSLVTGKIRRLVSDVVCPIEKLFEKI